MNKTTGLSMEYRNSSLKKIMEEYSKGSNSLIIFKETINTDIRLEKIQKEYDNLKNQYENQLGIDGILKIKLESQDNQLKELDRKYTPLENALKNIDKKLDTITKNPESFDERYNLGIKSIPYKDIISDKNELTDFEKHGKQYTKELLNYLKEKAKKERKPLTQVIIELSSSGELQLLHDKIQSNKI